MFCIVRTNRTLGENWEGSVPVYRIPGGYMLQFNPEYRFAPHEMEQE